MATLKQIFVTIAVLALLGLGASQTSDKRSWRWCCTSQNELDKCNDVASTNVNGRFLPITCVFILTEGRYACVNAIKNDEADVMILHSHFIFFSFEGLSVVGYEDYGMGDSGYFSLAAVKTENEHITMCTLKNAKSCHTAIGKSAGWNMPMGTLARHHSLSSASIDHFQLYDPFQASCAPGANNARYALKLPPSPPNTEKGKWCDLCIGDENGNHVCDRDADETYYGYGGAFRCLNESAGDVAFIKNNVIPDEDADRFSLLCKDGSRDHPSNWRSCNLGRIPSRGMIMRKGDDKHSETLIDALEYARANMDRSLFTRGSMLWSSRATFRASTHETVRDFLGEDYFCNMVALVGENIQASGCTSDPLQCPTE